jgi:hypothetical protein
MILQLEDYAQQYSFLASQERPKGQMTDDQECDCRGIRPHEFR